MTDEFLMATTSGISFTQASSKAAEVGSAGGRNNDVDEHEREHQDVKSRNAIHPVPEVSNSRHALPSY